MYTRLDGLAAIEAIEAADWQMEFDAYDEGNVSAFLDCYGEVIAALRWNDYDADGINFFETRVQNAGHGSKIIRELQAERPSLNISGELNSADCARFWHRLGMLESGENELFDGTVVVL